MTDFMTRALSVRPLCSVILTLAMGLLFAASALAQDSRNERTDVGPQASGFQHMLDTNGITLKLPPEGKAIVVNIPAYELIVFEDAIPFFRSKVIVGAPWHRTPRMETFVSSVRIRPTWRPTPSMIASGEYRNRVWPPGPNNPLGLAAVRLEPGLLIYLHDTNRRELFSKDMRALSHGCIRVERWADLVAWVLDLTLDDVHRLANGTKTLDLPAMPIPVFVGYYLRFPDDEGNIVTYPDVYRLGDRASDAKEDIPATATAMACSPPFDG